MVGVQLPLLAGQVGQSPGLHRAEVAHDQRALRLAGREHLAQVLRQVIVRPHRGGVEQLGHVPGLRWQPLQVLHLHPAPAGAEGLASTTVHVLVTQEPVGTDGVEDHLQLLQAAATQRLLGVQHVVHLGQLLPALRAERWILELLVQPTDVGVDVLLVEAGGMHPSCPAPLLQLQRRVQVELAVDVVGEPLQGGSQVVEVAQLHLLDGSQVHLPATHVHGCGDLLVVPLHYPDPHVVPGDPVRRSRVLHHVGEEVLPVRVVRYVRSRGRLEVVAFVRDGELLDQILAGLDLVDAQQLRGCGLQVGAGAHAPADHSTVDQVQLQRVQTHGADHATLEACVVRSEVDVVSVVDQHLTVPLVVLRALDEVEDHDVLVHPLLLPYQGASQRVELAGVQVVVQAHGRQRLRAPGLEVHADRVLATQLDV